uniref:Uncharacterized protein n=1 Tax=Arundo donax TaxID=35708 RepID=A0A0A9GV47_ARUDO
MAGRIPGAGRLNLASSAADHSPHATAAARRNPKSAPGCLR